MSRRVGKVECKLDRQFRKSNSNFYPLGALVECIVDIKTQKNDVNIVCVCVCVCLRHDLASLI